VSERKQVHILDWDGTSYWSRAVVRETKKSYLTLRANGVEEWVSKKSSRVFENEHEAIAAAWKSCAWAVRFYRDRVAWLESQQEKLWQRRQGGPR
jgi:hypothetical protein